MPVSNPCRRLIQQVFRSIPLMERPPKPRRSVHSLTLAPTQHLETRTLLTSGLVKDINLPGGSIPLDIVDVNGTIFFTAFDGIHGRELWKTDGTGPGTVLVKDIHPGSEGSLKSESNNVIFSYLTNVNGVLYFVADDGQHGYELWKSDGTEAGTVLVKDIDQTASSNTNYGPEELIDLNGTLYFYADDGVHGRELWKSDGTGAGTVMVKDINPGLASSVGGSFSSSGLRIFDNQLIFAANGGFLNGEELWVSDGTAEGTLMLKDLNGNFRGSFPDNFVVIGETMFFTGSSTFGSGLPVELWKTDGTAVGTVPVKIAFSGVPATTHLIELTAVGNTLFFGAGDEVLGHELWKSDGTEAGTVLVKDIRPGSDGSIISVDDSFRAVNGMLIFAADDGVHGKEIWKSDGTPAGTVMVKDVNPSNGFFYVRAPIVVGNNYYFVGVTDPEGFRLWKTDGTAAGTVMLLNDVDSELNASVPPAIPKFANINGVLYFTALSLVHPETDFELWRFDTDSVDPPPMENHAPGLDPGGNPSFDPIHNGECSEENNGTLVSDIIARMAPDGGISDPDTGAQQGIAINGLSNVADGIWEYSIDGGTVWNPVGTTGNVNARLLAADALTRIRFVPNPEFTGLVKISFVAWDRSSGVNGGIADVSIRGGSTPFSIEFEDAELSVMSCSMEGASDAVGVFRNGRFYLDANNSHSWNNIAGGDQVIPFGAIDAIPLVGDWNGDGITDLGVWNSGKFYLDANGNHVWNNVSGGDLVIPFGTSTDIPVSGDWNGDGKSDVGVFRAGKFYLDSNGNHKWDGIAGGDQIIRFGSAGDLPVVGDWNGDGATDLGIYRNGRFYLDANGNRTWDNLAGGDAYFNFGTSGDKPISGDWNGDGNSDVGVVRGATFYLDANGNRAWNNTTGGDAKFNFGTVNDIPVVGVWQPPAPPPSSSLSPQSVESFTASSEDPVADDRPSSPPPASLIAVPSKRNPWFSDGELLDNLFASRLQLI